MAMWNYNGAVLPQLPSGLLERYPKAFIYYDNYDSYNNFILVALSNDATYSFCVDNVLSNGNIYTDYCLNFRTEEFAIYYYDIYNSYWKDITYDNQISKINIPVSDIIWNNFDIVQNADPVLSNLRINNSQLPENIYNYSGNLYPDYYMYDQIFDYDYREYMNNVCIVDFGNGNVYLFIGFNESKFYIDTENGTLETDGFVEVYFLQANKWINTFYVNSANGDSIECPIDGTFIWSNIDIPEDSVDSTTIGVHASERTKVVPEGRVFPFESPCPSLPDGFIDEFPNIIIFDGGGYVYAYGGSSDAIMSNYFNEIDVSTSNFIVMYFNNETQQWDIEYQAENFSDRFYLPDSASYYISFNIIPAQETIGETMQSVEINKDVVNNAYYFLQRFPKLPDDFVETYPYIVIIQNYSNENYYKLLGCKNIWYYDKSDTNNLKLNHISGGDTCIYDYYVGDIDFINKDVGNYYQPMNSWRIVYTNYDIKYKNSSDIYRAKDYNGLYPFKYNYGSYVEFDALKDDLIVFAAYFREEVQPIDIFNTSYISNIFGNNNSNQYINIGYKKIEEDQYFSTQSLCSDLSNMSECIVMIFDSDYNAIKTLEQSIITSSYTSSKSINVPNKANDGIVIWVGSNNYSGSGKDLTTYPNDLLRVGNSPTNSPRLFAYVDMGDGAVERTFNFTSYSSSSGCGIILAPIVVLKNLEYTEYASWYAAMANEIRRLTNTNEKLTTEEMLAALKTL